MDLLSSDDDGDVQLTVNKDYAETYSKRKKLEEIGKLKEKFGNVSAYNDRKNNRNRNEDDEDDIDEDDSDSEPEDEFGELITPEVDAQIMKTIAMLRAKRPELYDSTTTFFSESDMEAAQKKWEEKKKGGDEKPVFLKDYQRQELLKQADGNSGESDAPKTHVQEQEELKRAFKDAIAAATDADDDLLTVRQKSKEEIEKEDLEYSKFLLEHMKAVDGEKWNASKMHVVDENDAFLMNYVLNRGWIDKEAKREPTYEDVVDDDEDEEEVEKAEQFEHKFNFRYEEKGGSEIATYSRQIDGLVRRKDDSRKRKREELKEKKMAEKKKKEEELKRLKNLKKEELREKLKKIQEMAGGEKLAFGEVDLEKDFDADEYDKMMQQTFDESYYNSTDGSVKPQFDDDDEIVADENVDEVAEEVANENDDNFVMDADFVPEKQKKKKKMGLEEYLDEMYQLDYEDMIGDTPTRFKYRQVEPMNYGLKAEEIFVADDADLNQIVSLKKLAAFRSEEVVRRDKEMWRKSKKRRLYEFRKKLKGNVAEEGEEVVSDKNSRLESFGLKKKKREL